MALDSVLDSLPAKLGGVNNAQTLQPIIDQLAAGASDGGMRGRIATMAASKTRSEMDDKVLNVMAAGALGVLPGGDNLKPVLEPIYGWRVNSFLSALRTAMVNSKALRETMKTRSAQYIFYPEFCTQFPDSVDQRIAAVARAHAGMGPSSPDLPALYTLGGRFDGAAALTQLKAMGKGGGGTSCVMTARAVYHAAGCDMIDGSEPSLNTPNGPVIDLGTPTKTTNSVFDQKKNQWVQKTSLKARHIRADIADDGKAFAAVNKDVRPHLTIGDIYLIEGSGDHIFLARGNGAFAVHVGIIVGHDGENYFTVDGGSGFGADVALSTKRQLAFKPDTGWAFGEPTKFGVSFAGLTHGFNNDEVAKIDAAGAALSTDEAISAKIKSDKAFAGFKANFDKALADYKGAIGTPKEAMFLKTLNMVRANVQRLARQIRGGEIGEIRTIHGWWESESYSQLAWAGAKEIATLMR
jgi:hypothetical protein